MTKRKADTALAIVKALAKEPMWKTGDLDDDNFRITMPRVKWPANAATLVKRARRYLSSKRRK